MDTQNKKEQTAGEMERAKGEGGPPERPNPPDRPEHPGAPPGPPGPPPSAWAARAATSTSASPGWSMLKRWWELWPGRLDYELRALESAGIPYERDEEAFHQGILRLRLRPKIEGEPLNLIAIFPDVYPYVRFEVYAPELDLHHHQHPFSKNLCLIGRATANWRVSDTLARFIEARLPGVLRAARTNDPAQVEGLEEDQGEPFSDYYPYLKDAIVLIDSSWSLDPTASKGELIIGVGEQLGWVLRGAVLEVHAENGGVLAKADPAFTPLYPKRIRGRWVRFQQPIREGDPGRFLTALTAENRDLERPVWQHLEGSRIDVIGILFPEEVRWRQTADGWIFAVRFKDKGQPRQGAYIARAGRTGRSDLAFRVPELAPLRDRRVAVMGLGGVGAPSALEFARSGIGELRILDHDTIDPGTIVRWPFGIATAGLTKIDALKDFINKHYPYTNVKGWQHRIGSIQAGGPSDLQVLDEVLDRVDLIHDATAEVGIQHLLADLASDRGITYLCVSTTQGAWGGLVARIRPRQTEGCWACLQHALTDGTIPSPPFDPGGEVQPVGCADPTFTGAGFDIGQIALAGVRMAVSTLSSHTKGGYPDIGWDVAVVSLRDRNGGVIPPRWETFPLVRHPSCACGKR